VPRAVFEDRVSKRIGVDLAALREVRHAPVPSREAAAPPRPRPAARTATALATAALDALALLASFPALAAVAREEHFPALYEGHGLEGVARALVDGGVEATELLRRIEPFVTTHALNRVRQLLGPARPDASAAEREFRKATVEAKIEALGQEIDRLSAAIALAGRPIPDGLRDAMLIATRRRADLEKRRDGRSAG
jgi:hypothetical protein